MTLQVWLAFAATSLVLIITPGPSILLAMVHSLNYGPRKTVFTALGDVSANAVQMLIVAAGLGFVVTRSELAFQTIKWGGVAVLLFMSFRMYRTSTANRDLPAVPHAASAFKLYVTGFLVAAGNPKALVFFTTFFPQFLDTQIPLAGQLLSMCPTIAALDFVFVMLYALGTKRALGFLQNHPRLMSRIGSATLAAAAGAMGLVAKVS